MDAKDESQKKPIRHFKDLRVWQEAHHLVVSLYKELKKFPANEQFGLISQMQRCVISITSNIAEGFGRESISEKIRFYVIARGSAIELENQLIASLDVGYLPQSSYNLLDERLQTVLALLNAFIKKTKTFRVNKK